MSRTAGRHPFGSTGPAAPEPEALPRHHRDPFDRMLVAQARMESLTIVTADRSFRDYDVDLLDATS
jgi:PIN domain nuclease of toxin-antitoxin system